MSSSTALKAAANSGDDDAFFAIVDQKRRNRMDAIDNLSPALRQCVHEYGWTTVNSFMALGIKNPKHIRHLVETVLNEFSPTRGSSSAQGIRAARGLNVNSPLSAE